MTDSESIGIKVDSDGTQNTRTWLEKDLARMLVAISSTQGNEHYFSMQANRDRWKFGKDTMNEEKRIADTISIEYIVK